MADDVGLPRSTVQKMVRDLLPQQMRITGDATELLLQCCNQFVHLVSTQANDISEREKRSTISPEHVIKALEELEFGPQYLDAVKAALEEWKRDNKDHREQRGGKKGEASGLTQAQLIELQHKLFEEARAATLSGPLPSLALDSLPSAAPPAEQQQQQDAQHQGQQGQQAAPEQQQSVSEPGVEGAGAPARQAGVAAIEDEEGDELGDDLDVDSELA